MKKKIKDLSAEEVMIICDNHRCKYCPLEIDEVWCKNDDLELYGDEEIEVEVYVD